MVVSHLFGGTGSSREGWQSILGDLCTVLLLFGKFDSDPFQEQPQISECLGYIEKFHNLGQALKLFRCSKEVSKKSGQKQLA